MPEKTGRLKELRTRELFASSLPLGEMESEDGIGINIQQWKPLQEWQNVSVRNSSVITYRLVRKLAYVIQRFKTLHCYNFTIMYSKNILRYTLLISPNPQNPT